MRAIVPWGVRQWAGLTIWATVLAACGFAVAHGIVRRLMGASLSGDDAKTAIFTQVWQWGYQPDNPPLFEWVIKLLQPLFGHGLLVFLVVKYAGLVAAAAFAHGAVRHYASDRIAFGAAVGMVLLYQVGWNLHEAFTHSALLLPAIAASAWAGLRAIERPTALRLALFGVSAGVAMMTKYNAVLFIVPFAVAVLMDPVVGQRWRVWRALIIIPIAMVILAPHTVWFFQQTEVFRETLDGTLGLDGGHLSRVGEGLGSLIVSAISFFLPWGLLVLALRAWPARAFLREERVLIRATLLSLGALFVGVIAFGIGNISERYLIPVLLPGYLALASAILGARPTLHRPLLWAVSGFAMLTIVLRLVQWVSPGPPLCSECGQFIPYQTLAAHVAERIEDDTILIVREENTGGNLYALFPDHPVRVFTSLHLTNPVPAPGRSCLLIWSEDMVGGVPLEPVVTYAYDDPETEIVSAPFTRPVRGNSRVQTEWGVTPILPGEAYERFCTPQR